MPQCANVEFPSLSSAAQVLRDHHHWFKVVEAEMDEQKLEPYSQGILVTEEHREKENRMGQWAKV